MAKAVIFDLDGTISDTQGYHAEIESEILAGLGVSITPQEVARRFSGRGLKEMFAEMAPHITYDMESVRAEKYFALGERMAKCLRSIPGAVNVVEQLHHEGFPLAIGTASRQFYAKRALKGLGLYHHFNAVACGDMVKRGKPEPDIFLLAAELLGMEPIDCLVIGDANADIEAARRAGMRSIRLIHPGMTAHTDSVPTRYVASLNEIDGDLVRSM